VTQIWLFKYDLKTKEILALLKDIDIKHYDELNPMKLTKQQKKSYAYLWSLWA